MVQKQNHTVMWFEQWHVTKDVVESLLGEIGFLQ